MLDKLLRTVKESFLFPFARAAGRYLHPNVITILSLVPGLLCCYCLIIHRYYIALVLWIVNRIVDGLDGTVARVYNKQSDFGGYLDILVDFIIYALIPIGLVVGSPSFASYLALAVLLGLFYVNGASWMYLSAILEKRKQGAREKGEITSVSMPSGLVGGTETIVFYILFILLPGYTVYLFAIMSLFVAVTIVQRLVWAIFTIR